MARGIGISSYLDYLVTIMQKVKEIREKPADTILSQKNQDGWTEKE